MAFERRESLKDAHRIVGAEHGDRRAEQDALGRAGDRGQHDFGRRDREVGRDGVRRRRSSRRRPDRRATAFVDDVAQHLRLRQRPAVGVEGDVAERVQTELKRLCHQSSLQRPPRGPNALWLRYCFVRYDDDAQSLKLLRGAGRLQAGWGASPVTVTLRPWNSSS